MLSGLHSVVPLRGSHLPQRLQTIANSISQHISNVTFEKIRPNRMVLNFKIDKSDRLWLLWCSSLRIEGKTYKSKDLQTLERNLPKNQTLNAMPLMIEHRPQVICVCLCYCSCRSRFAKVRRTLQRHQLTFTERTDASAAISSWNQIVCMRSQ